MGGSFENADRAKKTSITSSPCPTRPRQVVCIVALSVGSHGGEEDTDSCVRQVLQFRSGHTVPFSLFLLTCVTKGTERRAARGSKSNKRMTPVHSQTRDVLLRWFSLRYSAAYRSVSMLRRRERIGVQGALFQIRQRLQEVYRFVSCRNKMMLIIRTSPTPV